MKLSIGLSAAFASFVAASQQAAEVYILPAPSSTSTTTVSPSVARLILLQRLASVENGPSSSDIPKDFDSEEIVSLMNKFGKSPAPLFETGQDSPSQLLVMLEGMTDDQIKEMGADLKMKPAFTINDAPSASAHKKLIENDFFNAGVTNKHQCSLDKVVNPLEESCWSGRSTVAKYDVSKDPKVLKSVLDKISSLTKLADSKEMETTLVLLPVADSKAPNQWSEKNQELRRRQAAETVISEAEDTAEPPAPTNDFSDLTFFPTAKKGIPSCFESEDSCTKATANCSGHGSCKNRFAGKDGKDGKDICYVCQCTAPEKGGSRWAGAACSKKDISFQFWLFAGFTLAMVGILSMAIAMLFSVGNEKLPGVIGAGVSKSK